MYIDTTADRHVSNASDNIQSAITELSKVVIERVDGSDEYNGAFKSKLKTTLSELLEMRDRLNV